MPSTPRKSMVPGANDGRDIRILTTGTVIDPPGATYGPRLPDRYEFIWVMEGEGTITFGPKTFKAEAGTLLLRGPGVRDYYEWSPKRRTIHAYLQLTLGPEHRRWVDRSRVPAARKMPPNDILRPLFSYVMNLERTKEPTRTRLMRPALALMLESYVVGAFEVKPQATAYLPEPVERAVEAIRAHSVQSPPARLRLKDLAQAARTTPENLCRLFKKSLELGPLEYAMLVRLDRAANQMRRTPQRLKEISTATGFYDAYHLSRTFKKVYGLSPKAFRESPDNDWISQRNPIIRTLYN